MDANLCMLLRDVTRKAYLWCPWLIAMDTKDTKEPVHFCTQINNLPIILKSLHGERIVFHCIEQKYLLSQRKQSSQMGNYGKNGREPDRMNTSWSYTDHRTIYKILPYFVLSPPVGHNRHNSLNSVVS